MNSFSPKCYKNLHIQTCISTACSLLIANINFTLLFSGKRKKLLNLYPNSYTASEDMLQYILKNPKDAEFKNIPTLFYTITLLFHTARHVSCCIYVRHILKQFVICLGFKQPFSFSFSVNYYAVFLQKFLFWDVRKHFKLQHL